MPKLTAEETANRNQLIIQDMLRRIRPEVIAERHGVSVRTVWTAWEKKKITPALAPPESASREIQDHLDFLDALRAEAARLTETADQSSVRIASLREEERLGTMMFNLRREYGLVPYSARELDYEAGLRRIRDKLHEALEKNGIAAADVEAEIMRAIQGSGEEASKGQAAAILKLVPEP